MKHHLHGLLCASENMVVLACEQVQKVMPIWNNNVIIVISLNSFFLSNTGILHWFILVEDRSVFMSEGNDCLVTMFVEISNPVDRH